MYVSSNRPADFTCSHIKSVSDSVDASGMFSLTAEKIASYPSDSTTKELMKNSVSARRDICATSGFGQAFYLAKISSKVNLFQERN